MSAQKGEEQNGTNEGVGTLGYEKECVRDHGRRSLESYPCGLNVEAAMVRDLCFK